MQNDFAWTWGWATPFGWQRQPRQWVNRTGILGGVVNSRQIYRSGLLTHINRAPPASLFWDRTSQQVWLWSGPQQWTSLFPQ